MTSFEGPVQLMPSLTLGEALTIFLRTNYPERYCAACLALHVGRSPGELRDTLGRLLDRGAVVADTRVCHRCGRTVEAFAGRIGVRRKAL